MISNRQADLMQGFFKQLIEQYENEIDRFYVLFTFHFSTKNDDFEQLLKQYIKHRTIFHKTIITTPENKTFVLTEDDFRENAALFNKVFLYAREQLIEIVAKSVILHMLEENFSKNDYPIKEQQVQIQLTIMNLKETISKESFLAEDETWVNFYKTYRIHLIQLVLQQILIQHGNETISKIEKENLNKLFMRVMKEAIENHTVVFDSLIEFVNLQINEWKDRIIELYENRIASSLNENYSIVNKNSINSVPIQPVHATYIFVFNHMIYQAIREAIYRKSFTGGSWPTTILKKGKTEGALQCIPIQHNNELQSSKDIDLAWSYANAFTTIDVDVLDILCSLYIFKAKEPNEIIEIALDDILAMRGLKSKLAGNGRRGGYEQKQREQIITSLQRLQSLWISIDKTVFYSNIGKNETSIACRAILFKTLDAQDYIISEKNCELKISYTFDEQLTKHIFQERRQIALLPIKALQYHAYRFSLEKQLCRYLSWRWRTQAAKVDFLQANKVSTLLAATNFQVNLNSPQRIRDRLEKALDHLKDDHVIADWHYVELNEDIMLKKGWLKYWYDTSIVIEPPNTIQRHYHSIHKRKKPSESMNEYTVKNKISLKLALARKNQRLTLLQLGEILGVSAAYISMIEREQAIPSKKLINRIEKWLG